VHRHSLDSLNARMIEQKKKIMGGEREWNPLKRNVWPGTINDFIETCSDIIERSKVYQLP